MIIRGPVFVFGDHVNTDEIIAARYLNRSDMHELAGLLMEDIRPGFGRRPDLAGAVLAAGVNFGCGSSREHAPQVIRAAGIAAVVARSFARIFLRNAVNIGLPVITLAGDAAFREGAELVIDTERGLVRQQGGPDVPCTPYPPFLQEIMEAGGWLPFCRRLPADPPAIHGEQR